MVVCAKMKIKKYTLKYRAYPQAFLKRKHTLGKHFLTNSKKLKTYKNDLITFTLTFASTWKAHFWNLLYPFRLLAKSFNYVYDTLLILGLRLLKNVKPFILLERLKVCYTCKCIVDCVGKSFTSLRDVDVTKCKWKCKQNINFRHSSALGETNKMKILIHPYWHMY